jgi:cytochrome c peroxidase
MKGVYLIFTFLFFVFKIISAESDSSPKRIADNKSSYSSQDVRVGERLFHGLIPSATKTINCASCHNTTYKDTFNWNPSAMDLAVKYAAKDFASLKQL